MDGLKIQFIKYLSKFKVAQFPAVLSSIFGEELTWEEFKKLVDRRRIDKRPSCLAEICWKLYSKTKPSEDDARMTIWMIQLCEVALNSNRSWFGFKMSDPFPDYTPSIEELESSIMQAYKNEQKKVHVVSLLKDDFIYISVREEIFKKTTKLLSPVYFVWKASSTYGFFAPKSIKTYHLYSISSAFGYQEHELIVLSGRDLSSLYDKVNGNCNRTVAVPFPTFEPLAIQSECIIDSTGYRLKEHYAKQILKSSEQKHLTVKSCNPWRGSTFPLRNGDAQITSTLTIQSRGEASVADVLRDLIVRGNIGIPLPSWVSDFASQQTDVVTLSSCPAIQES